MSDTKEQIPISKPSGVRRNIALLLRAAEQVAVDESRDQGIRHNLQVLTNRTLGKRERVAAGLQIIYYCFPQFVKEKIKDRLEYTDDQLPFDPKDYTLTKKIGYGAMNDIFLLQSNTEQASYVLKVFIDALGEKDISKLTAMAAQQKADYDKVARRFNDVPGLVPPEYFVVLQGPRDNTPAVVTLQPFVGGRVRDIFEVENLQEIVTNNTRFRKQLVGFLGVLDNNPDLLDYELDLIGKANLAIVGEEGEERLLLLDPHSISLENRHDFYSEEIHRRVNVLKGVLANTESIAV